MKLRLFLFSSIYTLLFGCGGSGGAGNAVNITGNITITGNTINEQTLTANVEDGNGLTDVEITYSWFARDPSQENARDEVIEGETNNTLVLTEDQIGSIITASASYIDADNFQERHTSASTARISAIDVAGVVNISGPVAVGRRLTATVSDANGISGNINYQWAAAGNNIANANTSTYVLTENELGETITVMATYTDDEGFNSSVSSAPTEVVAAAIPDVPGMLTIIGTASVGETLTAELSDDDGIQGSVSYQWMASGNNIALTKQSTYLVTNNEVGEMITVTATYTDNGSTMSTLTSTATASVTPAAMNIEGIIAINGTLEVGEMLTSVITDPNGVSGNVVYIWSADGVAISGATSATYTLTPDQRGQTITISAQYTDDNGFTEAINSTATDRIFSFIVDGESSLASASVNAVDGDWIGLDTAASDDYINMAEIEFMANNLTITKTSGSTAEVSGATCIVLGGDNITMDGLSFDNLSIISSSQCDSNGDSSIYLEGDNITLSNSEFKGEAGNPGASTFNWISVKGLQNIIERNYFTDKDNKADHAGAIITVFNNSSAQSQEAHIIR